MKLISCSTLQSIGLYDSRRCCRFCHTQAHLATQEPWRAFVLSRVREAASEGVDTSFCCVSADLLIDLIPEKWAELWAAAPEDGGAKPLLKRQAQKAGQ